MPDARERWPSEHAVGAGLRHDLQFVGLALEVAVLDSRPRAADVAGGAEPVGKLLGGFDLEDGCVVMSQL